MAASSAPAGWYHDPRVADQQRYWDGQQWTAHVAPLQRPPTQQPWGAPAASDTRVHGAVGVASGAGSAAAAAAVATAHPQSAAAEQEAEARPGNTYGTLGLVLAVVALAACVPFAGFAWLFALPAIVLGIRGSRERDRSTGTSTAAIVLGVLAWILAIAVTLPRLLT